MEDKQRTEDVPFRGTLEARDPQRVISMSDTNTPGTVTFSTGDPLFAVEAVWSYTEMDDSTVITDYPEVYIYCEQGAYSTEEARDLARWLLGAADRAEREHARAVSRRRHPDWLVRCRPGEI